MANWRGKRHLLDPDSTIGVSKRLRDLGFFRVRELTSAVDYWDLSAVYLSAVGVNGRRVAAFRYGPPKSPDGRTLERCAIYLDEFITSLGSGQTYAPPRYLFDSTMAGSDENLPVGHEFAAPWRWAALDLLALYRAGQTEMHLPPSSVGPLRSFGTAYADNLAILDRYYYRVRWRPLYPHE